MAQACNLLITHDVQHAEYARDNARGVLAHLGASGQFLEDSPPGVFEVVLPGDPRALVRAAAALCTEDPSRFAHTHHWRPVEAWVKAEKKDMVQAIEGLAPRIGPEDTWRLTLDIHGPSQWHTHDLLKPLTDPVKRGRVHLDDPAKELRVDILGSRAGIALLERGDDLSVDQLRGKQMALPQEV